MGRQLFRKAPLERLSSPEQLDLLMPVTGPLSWVALISGLILLSIAAYWGFHGEIETRVSGEGILLRKESLRDVVCTGNGRIEKLMAEVDDKIKAGQLLAVLSQPDLEHEVSEVENQLRLQETDLELARTYGLKAEQLKIEHIAEQRAAIEQAVKADRQRMEYLGKQLEDRKKLRAEGLMTELQVQETAYEYERVLGSIREYQAQISSLSGQQVDFTSQKEKELAGIRNQISQSQERLRALRASLVLRGRTVSPVSGRVLELYGSVGKVIQTGDPLLSVEVETSVGEALSAVLYFPLREGKRVVSGMPVQIAPSVAKREEYGTMLGAVTQVSAFPASGRGMMRVLQNEDLVRKLSSGGAPIMVYASLIPSRENPSGYKWSSGAGPPLEIESGTLCSAGVVVNRQRPIDLVVPYLRRHLLGEGQESEAGSEPASRPAR